MKTFTKITIALVGMTTLALAQPKGGTGSAGSAGSAAGSAAAPKGGAGSGGLGAPRGGGTGSGGMGGGSATGSGGTGGGSATGQGSAGTPTKPEMPKPPTELADYAKAHAGTWRCKGTSFNMMDNSTADMTGTVAAKLDVDKWWVTETVTAKDKMGPFKMVSYTTYDAASKKWRRVGVASGGMQMVGTSDGPKEGKTVWNLEALAGGNAMQFRDSIDATDAKAGVKMRGEFSMDRGKSWKPAYEWTCKK